MPRRYQKRTRKPQRKNQVSRLKKDIRYLKSINCPEYKKHTQSLDFTFDNAGNMISLSNIGAGDTNATRDGNAIINKYFNLKFSIFAHGSSSNTQCRILVFQWRSPEGSDPSVADVLNSASIYAPYNPNNSGRRKTGLFTVHIDKLINLARDDNKSTFLFKRNMKLGNCNVTKFLGEGTTDANAGPNSWYMLALSDEATNAPTLEGVWRLTYLDN